jgi:aldose 1-epimerase
MFDRVPSGEQWMIEAAGHRAVVVEVGGGLRGYDVSGEPYLDGYARDEIAPSGAGQVLAPWPNRLGDGAYRFGGASYQVALSEPAAHNAAHGLVRWLPWRRVDATADRITVEVVLTPHPGYPWALHLRTGWSVGPDGLRAEHEVTNLGSSPAPFGLGTHPYLRVPGTAVDDVELTVPAASRLLVDGRQLPIGEAAVAGTDLDFTSPRRIGSTRLDTTFGDLARDADGGSSVLLRGRDGAGVRVWSDAAFGWWQVFTGDGLTGGSARRAVAVEPMTCPPDALRSGRDLVVLEPGEIWRGHWGIRPLSGS